MITREISITLNTQERLLLSCLLSGALVELTEAEVADSELVARLPDFAGTKNLARDLLARILPSTDMRHMILNVAEVERLRRAEEASTEGANDGQ